MRNWLKLDKVTIFTAKDESGNRYLSQFLRDYQDTFKPDMINAGCDRCLEDYYKKFTKYLSTMSNESKNSGYVLLKKYEGIPLAFGSRILVNNANLTDEIAEKLLKNHPRGKDLFEKIPEKKVSAEKKTSDKVPVKSRLEVLKEMKRAELDKEAENLGLTPKDYANKDEISIAIEAAEKKASEIEVNP